jgi:hypothetical protein
MPEAIVIIVIIQAVACSVFSQKLAEEKGYSMRLWFLGGLVFGIIGLIAAAGLPNKRSEF